MSRGRTRWTWWAGAAVIAALLLAARLWPTRDAAAVAVDEPEEEAFGVDVQVVAPARLIERLATTGTIQADEQVQLRAEIAGIVERIDFDEGTRVERGALLVELDDEELTAQRDRARFRYELAKQRESRQQDLMTQGLISQDEYDTALNQLNVLEAELRLAGAALAKTRIHAPFSGLIGFRFVSVGAAIGTSTPIATLQRIDPVKVEFSVPERYAARVRTGEEIVFRVKGLEERRLGRIYAIQPTVDPETRSLRARARSANADGSLLPGAFADVEIVIREIEDALTVPAIAVVPELGGKKVFVMEDGRAVPRVVETGIRTETDVEVTRGLEVGDRVIVSGVQQLAAGARVTERGPEEAP